MSQRIARLLGEPEHQVTKMIAKLEAKNGYPSHDARFLAETAQTIRSKLNDLNLDPDDTTAEELYHALQVKFERDSRLFNEYFGAQKLNSDEITAKAIQLVVPYAESARQWCLKSKAAKNIIRQLPPKKLMKKLGYRSVESLLKREDLADIYLASGLLESDRWAKAHKKLVSKLDQTDFEIRQVKLTSLSSKKWNGLSSHPDFLVQNEEIGAIGIYPSEVTAKAPLLSLILMLLEEISRYTDVKSSRAAAHLNGIAAWWADMDHLMAELSGQPLSLSLKDAALNQMNDNVFESRHLAHGRAAFWRELVSRYENLPEIDGLFDDSVRQRVAGLKLSGPEPAYEFVEDF